MYAHAHLTSSQHELQHALQPATHTPRARILPIHIHTACAPMHAVEEDQHVRMHCTIDPAGGAPRTTRGRAHTLHIWYAHMTFRRGKEHTVGTGFCAKKSPPTPFYFKVEKHFARRNHALRLGMPRLSHVRHTVNIDKFGGAGVVPQNIGGFFHAEFPVHMFSAWRHQHVGTCPPLGMARMTMRAPASHDWRSHASWGAASQGAFFTQNPVSDHHVVTASYVPRRVQVRTAL